jgi:hypothetical protein
MVDESASARRAIDAHGLIRPPPAVLDTASLFTSAGQHDLAEDITGGPSEAPVRLVIGSSAR